MVSAWKEAATAESAMGAAADAVAARAAADTDDGLPWPVWLVLAVVGAPIISGGLRGFLVLLTMLVGQGTACPGAQANAGLRAVAYGVCAGREAALHVLAILAGLAG